MELRREGVAHRVEAQDFLYPLDLAVSMVYPQFINYPSMTVFDKRVALARALAKQARVSGACRFDQ